MTPGGEHGEKDGQPRPWQIHSRTRRKSKDEPTHSKTGKKSKKPAPKQQKGKEAQGRLGALAWAA